MRVEQGGTSDGHVRRDTVADAIIAALGARQAVGATLEIYDDPGDRPADLSQTFTRPLTDHRFSVDRG